MFITKKKERRVKIDYENQNQPSLKSPNRPRKLKSNWLDDQDSWFTKEKWLTIRV